MQEGDVQIKGYPVRLPLDVLLAFTANPEDYTARGKIITPLKDRIGSEIITHYPRTVQLGMEITAQEAWPERGGPALDIPDFVLEVIERVAFEAREDKRVDKRSGVSQRLPISAARERRLQCGAPGRRARRGPRRAAGQRRLRGGPLDHRKLELEYEGELQGGDTIARELIRRAAGRVLEERWVARIWARSWPGSTRAARSRSRATSGPRSASRASGWCPGLVEVVAEFGLADEKDAPRMVAACELVLEGLAAQKRISRSEELGYTRAKPERREPGYGKGGISFG